MACREGGIYLDQGPMACREAEYTWIRGQWRVGRGNIPGASVAESGGRRADTRAAGQSEAKMAKCLFMLSLSGRGAALLEMGTCHRLASLCPNKFGYFRPIANRSRREDDTHAYLINSVRPPPPHLTKD
eukprot:1071553-Prorocentrum_minimum.AAC.2